MKNISFLSMLAVVTIAIFACKKIEFRNDISGSWKIYLISGGIAGQTFVPHFTDLYMKKNNHYFLYRNDSLLASGSYELNKIASNIPGSGFEILFRRDYIIDNKIVFPFNKGELINFSSADTLFIIDYCCDGLSWVYYRPK